MSPFKKLYGTDAEDDFRSAAAVQKKPPVFKPLSLSVDENDGAEGGATRNSAEILEAARQNAHERGDHDGREEAGRMAKASLTPGLRQFIEQFQTLVDDGGRIAADTSAGALELAHIIAGKVLGAAASVSADHLAAVQPDLQAALGRANRITLAMHPEDLAALEALAREEQLPWPGDPRIVLQGDPGLARGALHIAVAESRDGIIDAQVTAGMADRLSHDNS